MSVSRKSLKNKYNFLNSEIFIGELKYALCNVGRGTGLGDMPPVTYNLFRKSLNFLILNFLRRIFNNGAYPKSRN